MGKSSDNSGRAGFALCVRVCSCASLSLGALFALGFGLILFLLFFFSFVLIFDYFKHERTIIPPFFTAKLNRNGGEDDIVSLYIHEGLNRLIL